MDPALKHLLAAELARSATGDPLRAALHLSAQHQATPNDPDVSAALGLAFAVTGELSAAAGMLERAHYLDPSNPRHLYCLGLALEARERPEDADLRYEATLRLDPDHAGARHRLARDRPDPSAAMGGDPMASPGPALARVAPPEPRPPAPLRANPSRRATVPHLLPDPSPRWAPRTPSFGMLARGVLLVWTSNPLLWLVLLALPNGLAAAAVPQEPEFTGEATLIWLAAFGLGAALVLPAMVSAWINGRRSGVPFYQFGAGLLVALPYLLLAVAPWCVWIALRTPVPLEANLLGTLLLTSPFHALLAPALTLAAQGESPGTALRGALRIAGRRTWLHLALMLSLGTLLGGIGTAIAWSFVVSMQGNGEVVAALLRVAGLALGESLWAALVTICGLDALAARRPAVD